MQTVTFTKVYMSPIRVQAPNGLFFRHGAEEVAAGSSSERKPAAMFRGTGYRLGDEEGGQSHMVMGAPVNQGPKQVVKTPIFQF